MAKKPSRKQYAETLGEITIEWNYLERAINVIGYYYLQGDKGVASHVFGGMGNVSKAGFISYLTERFEDDEGVAGHVYHLLKTFNILRENRNILEHSVPYQSFGGAYLDAVTKLNTRGERLSFELPFDQLEEILDDMIRAADYARTISMSIYQDYEPDPSDPLSGDEFRALARKALASIEKPPLPRKIEKLPPPEDQPDD